MKNPPIWPNGSVSGVPADEIQRKLGIVPALARALASRGFTPEELSNIKPSPGTVKAILREIRSECPEFQKSVTQAAQKILDFGKSGKRLGIFTDYDVDGAVSATCMVETFRRLSFREPLVRTPCRVKTGFGPQAGVMKEMLDLGVDAFICLDCGTEAEKTLAKFEMLAVIDHHDPGRMIEEFQVKDCVLVNPWVSEYESEHPLTWETRKLCAGALSAVVAMEILTLAGLEGQEIFQDRARLGILAAFSTICDVMDISVASPLNRSLVKEGLSVSWAAPIGLQMIGWQASTDRDPLMDPASWTAETFGWKLGPMVNAGSRMGHSGLAVSTMICQDQQQALARAKRLSDLNAQRKFYNREQTRKAIAVVGMSDIPPVVHLPDCTGGVIGLVASALVGETGFPAFVIGQDKGRGYCSGSARTSGTVHVGNVVRAGVQAGVLASGGGHEGAAGFSVRVSKIKEAISWLQDALLNVSQGEPVPVEIDAILHLSCMRENSLYDLYQSIESLAPWGNRFPKPIFGAKGMRVTQTRTASTSKDMVFGELVSEDGSAKLPYVQFRAGWDSPLRTNESQVDIWGEISMDMYKGRPQMIVVGSRNHVPDASS